MPAAKKTYKLELFPLLRNISTKNVGYYETLSEEQLKEFAPLVLMRWLTGCNDGQGHSARQVYFLNQFLNPFVFHLGKHKKLLYDLMTLCTTGRDCRYTFNKTKSKKGGNLPKSTAVVKRMYNYNTKDAQEAVTILTADQILNMAEQLGYQTAELKELKKELKNKQA
jgi:hypothetical protein